MVIKPACLTRSRVSLGHHIGHISMGTGSDMGSEKCIHVQKIKSNVVQQIKYDYRNWILEN